MIDENRKKNLFLNIQKLQAYHELQNEMGRLTAAFNFHQKDKVLSFFALDLSDVAIEYADEGLFEGREAVEACIDILLGEPLKEGEMLDMQLTTPMIEVADDLQTAKCLWWCPGAGSLVQEGKDPQAIWAWGQVAVDFIHINDSWKVWHLHYFRFIKCDYHKGWVDDTTMIHRPNTALHPLSKPTTYHNPYSPNSVREGLPSMPLPYETYTEEDRFWELNRNKE